MQYFKAGQGRNYEKIEKISKAKCEIEKTFQNFSLLLMYKPTILTKAHKKDTDGDFHFECLKISDSTDDIVRHHSIYTG